MNILMHELKELRKSLIIWSLTLGVICYGCILLYQSLAGSIDNIADSYAKMGDMSKVFGLDKVSLATLDGYFATEIALMFGIGSGMFASLIGVISLSKEEEGHTSEFLYTLPYSRLEIIAWKCISIFVTLICFNIIGISMEVLGIWQTGLKFSTDSFLQYHLAAFIMQLECYSICFLISALSRRRQVGMALGVTLILYIMDMMGRLIPDIENIKYITPYYFANGAAIFSKAEQKNMIPISLAVSCTCLLASFVTYQKRDLSA